MADEEAEYSAQIEIERAQYELHGGFKCRDCGFVQPFRNPIFQAPVLDHYFMIQASGPDALCNHCLSEWIRAKADFTTDEECSWCQRPGVPAVGWIGRSLDDETVITFGQGWWNGFHICRDCLAEGLGDPKLTGSTVIYENGLALYANELGITVKVDK